MNNPAIERYKALAEVVARGEKLLAALEAQRDAFTVQSGPDPEEMDSRDDARYLKD